MSEGKLEGRVMVLENTLKYTLPRIETYMKEGNELRVEGMQKLTELSSAVINIGDYKKMCDKDREELAKRITAAERKLAQQHTIVATVAVVFTVIGNILAYGITALTSLLKHTG